MCMQHVSTSETNVSQLGFAFAVPVALIRSLCLSSHFKGTDWLFVRFTFSLSCSESDEKINASHVFLLSEELEPEGN